MQRTLGGMVNDDENGDASVDVEENEHNIKHTQQQQQDEEEQQSEELSVAAEEASPAIAVSLEHDEIPPVVAETAVGLADSTTEPEGEDDAISGGEQPQENDTVAAADDDAVSGGQDQDKKTEADAEATADADASGEPSTVSKETEESPTVSLGSSSAPHSTVDVTAGGRSIESAIMPLSAAPEVDSNQDEAVPTPDSSGQTGLINGERAQSEESIENEDKQPAKASALDGNQTSTDDNPDKNNGEDAVTIVKGNYDESAEISPEPCSDDNDEDGGGGKSSRSRGTRSTRGSAAIKSDEPAATDDIDEEPRQVDVPSRKRQADRQKGKWSEEEHELFLAAHEKFKHDETDKWKKIAAMVKTRDVGQTRAYADRHFKKHKNKKKSGGGSRTPKSPSRRKTRSIKDGESVNGNKQDGDMDEDESGKESIAPNDGRGEASTRSAKIDAEDENVTPAELKSESKKRAGDSMEESGEDMEEDDPNSTNQPATDNDDDLSIEESRGRQSLISKGQTSRSQGSKRSNSQRGRLFKFTQRPLPVKGPKRPLSPVYLSRDASSGNQRKRKRSEQDDPPRDSADDVEWATELDWLKGKTNHPGNVYYKERCDAVRSEYYYGDSETKESIIKRIAHEITFWVYANGRWEKQDFDPVQTRLYKNLSDKRRLAPAKAAAAAKSQEKVVKQKRDEKSTEDGDDMQEAATRRPIRVSAGKAKEKIMVAGIQLMGDSDVGDTDDLSALHTAEQEDKVDVPLSSPPPLPSFPTDSRAKWSFDEETRCLYANFEGLPSVSACDKRFLAAMMERDDITVISEGLIELDEALWNFEGMERCLKGKAYHNIRRFDRRVVRGVPSWVERDRSLSMKVTTYLKYLSLSFEAQTIERSIPFEFLNARGEPQSIDDIRDVALYMIDVDMPKLLPQLDSDYKTRFKIKEMLPSGAWCMMNTVPASERPFMGPNLYMSPGGAFTQLHQDGFGTTDSGHSCLMGYNEVVMLRRLPEEHKRNACRYLPKDQDTEGRADRAAFDPLYGLPHDDNKAKRPLWATTETIREWTRMGYCPSVFILKPGQHVHINKGRLHAFRKLSLDALPEKDCHASLRRDLIKREGLTSAPICASVAFDWNFLGFSRKGIERETLSTMECAANCQRRKSKCLAIPEASIIHIARNLQIGRAPVRKVFAFKQAPSAIAPTCVPVPTEVCKGILPALRKIVDSDSSQPGEDPRTADVNYDPATYTIDPYGNDYFCKICHRELSNVYYHCEGCEILLNKDFNICARCWRTGAYKHFERMHPVQDMKRSDVNHLGQPINMKNQGCICEDGEGASCSYCDGCMICSCRCHIVFRKHLRLASVDDMKALLQDCEDHAGADVAPSEGEDDERKMPAVENGVAMSAKSTNVKVEDEVDGTSRSGREVKTAKTSSEKDVEANPVDEVCEVKDRRGVVVDGDGINGRVKVEVGSASQASTDKAEGVVLDETYYATAGDNCSSLEQPAEAAVVGEANSDLLLDGNDEDNGRVSSIKEEPNDPMDVETTGLST